MKAFMKFPEPYSDAAADPIFLAIGPANELDFGRFILEPPQSCIDRGMSLPLSPEHTIAARQKIDIAIASSDAIPIICSGWAMSFVTLLDGRRQILSFLLPGDVLSTSLAFGPAEGHLVETITRVSYRTIKRSDLQTQMFKHPDLMKSLSRLWIDQIAQANQLAVDLGRRTAERKLARLILKLMQKLAARGMAQGDKFHFPLRQRQIADATGLTPVHVSRVLSKFRRARLIAIDGSFLVILNAKELRRVAGP